VTFSSTVNPTVTMLGHNPGIPGDTSAFHTPEVWLGSTANTMIWMLLQSCFGICP